MATAQLLTYSGPPDPSATLTTRDVELIAGSLGALTNEAQAPAFPLGVGGVMVELDDGPIDGFIAQGGLVAVWARGGATPSYFVDDLGLEGLVRGLLSVAG